MMHKVIGLLFYIRILMRKDEKESLLTKGVK